MEWHPDIPDIPISKPKKIEQLEKMDRKLLDSMPGVEIDELIEDAANSIADTYQKEVKTASYNECIEIVSVGLNVTGAAIGGKAGLALIAASDKEAAKACRLFFTKASN